MARVLFVQNGETDRPGLFQRVMEELGVGVQVCHAWDGEAVPDALERWDAVVIGGGAMSAWETEEFPFLEQERELVAKEYQSGRPILGFCLGAQLMAAALGGEGRRNSTREIGFHEVQFTREAEADALWQGLTTPFSPVHWHRDTFSLPSGAALLGSSEITPHQIFRVGKQHYGLQFHLEIDQAVLEAMITSDGAGLAEVGVDPEAFLAEGATAFPKVEPIARAIFRRWAEMLPV